MANRMNPLRHALTWAMLGTFVALLAAPGLAWADYGAREREAKSELAKAGVTDEERDTLEDALDDYFDARERCLSALVDILKPDDEKPRHDKFLAHATQCQTSGAKRMREAVDDLGDEPSVAALGFVSVFGSHEAAFMSALAAMSVGQGRDKIVEIRVHLEEMTGNLDKKWKAIVDQDTSIDERAKRISDEIRKDFEEITRRVASSTPDAVETIAEVVKTYAESSAPSPPTGRPHIDEGIAIARAVIAKSIPVWQAWNTRSTGRADRYKAAFQSERRVLVMFVDVREDVEEFLEHNDYPVAEKAFGAAKKSASAFVGKAKTSGQKSDAAELRNDIMEVLADHLKETADVHGTFVDRHKEKFFGALGPQIKEELLETRAWRQHHSWMQGYSLDRKLNAWQKNATNLFEVDLSPLSSENRDKLKLGLRAVIEDLVDEMKRSAKSYGKTLEAIDDGRANLADALD